MELLSSRRQRAQEPVGERGVDRSELTSEHVAQTGFVALDGTTESTCKPGRWFPVTPGAPGCRVGFFAATFLRTAITGHDRSPPASLWCSRRDLSWSSLLDLRALVQLCP